MMAIFIVFISEFPTFRTLSHPIAFSNLVRHYYVFSIIIIIVTLFCHK